jgi:hypothetical protein
MCNEVADAGETVDVAARKVAARSPFSLVPEVPERPGVPNVVDLVEH